MIIFEPFHYASERKLLLLWWYMAQTIPPSWYWKPGDKLYITILIHQSCPAFKRLNTVLIATKMSPFHEVLLKTKQKKTYLSPGTQQNKVPPWNWIRVSALKLYIYIYIKIGLSSRERFLSTAVVLLIDFSWHCFRGAGLQFEHLTPPVLKRSWSFHRFVWDHPGLIHLVASFVSVIQTLWTLLSLCRAR